MRWLILLATLSLPARASEYLRLMEQVHQAEAAQDHARELDLRVQAVKAWQPGDGAHNLRVGLTNVGVMLFEDHRYEDAVAFYDRALKIEPGHSVTHVDRASALQSLHRWDQALPDIDAAARDPETNHNAAQAYCVTFMVKDDWSRALEYCKGFLDQQKTPSVMAYQQLAMVYAHLGRQKDAEAALEASLSAPNMAQFDANDRWLYEPAARVTQAVVWEFAGQGGRADDDLTRLAAAMPDKTYVLYHRGRLRLDLGRFDSATADFDRVLQLEPFYAEALVWRAAAHEKAGRTKLAAADRAQACARGWRDACPRKRR